jgi:membrane associated rhomboid family serine protease
MFPLYDNIPSGRFPVVTCTLIAINFLVQIWTVFMPANDAARFEYTYGFIPARLAQLNDDRPIVVPIRLEAEDPDTGQIVEVNKKLKIPADRGAIIISLFTAMFLHAGWLHLLGNMWFLWIFGDNVEDRLGYIGFLIFYLVCGLLANLCHWLSDPQSTIVVVGASGAIAAVLGAYAISWPHARVRTLIMLVVFITVIDVPAWVILGIWFVTQVFEATGTSNLELHGGVAFWAHIGGFVVGVVLMSIFGRRRSEGGSGRSEVGMTN